MGSQQSFSEWINRTVIAAIFSVLGYFGQDFYTDWKDQNTANDAARQQLVRLQDSLNESKSIFINQNYMAQRLFNMLLENHPSDVQQGQGYDETFYRMHDKFLPDEAELQAIIRSTTMHSMHRVNQDMRDWLDADKIFKQTHQLTPERQNLAAQLQALALHLNQWRDKYEATIPGDKRRSLVYLADEKQHGVGFPNQIDALVATTIDHWSQ